MPEETTSATTVESSETPAATPPAAPAPKPARSKAKAPAEFTFCRVEMRREHGGFAANQPIAEFRLPAGVSWNFVIDAIKNDFARVVEADLE
jgi:hypothetical protein